MTSFTLYLELYQAGLLLSTDGEKLLVTPADKLTDELRLAIRQHKPELIELLQSAHHTTGRLLDWVVDLDPHTTVATAIRFRTASLALDEQAPAPANNLLDKAGEDHFFNATKFPESKFEITGITSIEGKTTVNGNLTIKNITKPVSFPAKVTYEGDTMMLVSEAFMINRTQWNVNYASKSIFDNLKDKFVNDEIELVVKLNATKK